MESLAEILVDSSKKTVTFLSGWDLLEAFSASLTLLVIVDDDVADDVDEVSEQSTTKAPHLLRMFR